MIACRKALRSLRISLTSLKQNKREVLDHVYVHLRERRQRYRVPLSSLAMDFDITFDESMIMIR